LRAFVEGLIFFFGFEDDFEDAGFAGSVEQSVKGLEIFGEEVLQTWLPRGLRWSLGIWWLGRDLREIELWRLGWEGRQVTV
jgi:hypothetical protein